MASSSLTLAQSRFRGALSEAVPARALATLSVVATQARTPVGQISALRSAALEEGMDARTLRDLAMFHAGHECGRGYWSLIRTLHEHGRELRAAARAAAPPASEPSP